MQNNKSNGKAFLILIPLAMIIISFLYENVIIIGTEKKYHLDSENIIKEVLSNSYDDSEKAINIERLYNEKGYETEQLTVRYENNNMYVYNVHVYPSFFSRLFGVKYHRTEVDLKAYSDNKEIIIQDNEE